MHRQLVPGGPDRRDHLRRVARQDHAPGRVNLRLIERFQQAQGKLGLAEVGVVGNLAQRRQVARVEPEQRQRDRLRLSQMEDRAQQQLAPQVGDRLHECVQARRARHGLAVEDPVEGQAVVGLEDGVADRAGAVRRGDAVTRDGDALLDAHHRARQIGRDQQTAPAANGVFDDCCALGGPLVRIEHAGENLPSCGKHGDAVEKVQRERDVIEQRVGGAAGIQIAFAEVAGEAVELVGRRLHLHAEKLGQPAHAADADPRAAGLDPRRQLLLQRGRRLRLAHGEQDAQARQALSQGLRGDLFVAEARMAQDLVDVVPIGDQSSGCSAGRPRRRRRGGWLVVGGAW